MKLTMISHACVAVEEGSVCLLTDPWFMGEAFNESWSLLLEPALDCEALQKVTHMWISHEHPDHLSFASLKSIPAEQKSRIVVLYQRHLSTRVVQALNQQGFRAVQELPLGRWFRLSDDISLLCYSIGSIDSLLTIKTRAVTLLNLNDCIITPRVARMLAQKLGSVDVLLTQFSIAGWVGNPGEREVAARENVLARMKMCVRLLKPKITIPFASFVYFSHVENRYMNSWINTPDRICQEMAAQPTRLQFLYNGDSWSSRDGFLLTGDPLERYRAEFNRIPDLPYRSHPSYPLEEILRRGNELVDQVRCSVPTVFLRWCPAIYFYILDLKRAIRFDLYQGVVEAWRRSETECDLALSSQAIWYAFKFPWGFSTLEVSGRYKVTNPKASKSAMYVCHLLASDILFSNLWRSMRNGRFWAFYGSKRVEILDRVLSRITRTQPIYIPETSAARRAAGA